MVTASKSDSAEGLAEPIALIELQSKLVRAKSWPPSSNARASSQRHAASSTSGGTLRWEANRDQLQGLLAQFDEIEAAISAAAE